MTPQIHSQETLLRTLLKDLGVPFLLIGSSMRPVMTQHNMPSLFRPKADARLCHRTYDALRYNRTNLSIERSLLSFRWQYLYQ